MLGIKSFDVEATAPIPTGTTQLRMEFAYDGGGMGKGGDVKLYCDGNETGTTVSPDYTAHTSKFTGKINWIRIDLGDDAEEADHYIEPDERFRIAMARQ